MLHKSCWLNGAVRRIRMGMAGVYRFLPVSLSLVLLFLCLPDGLLPAAGVPSARGQSPDPAPFLDTDVAAVQRQAVQAYGAKDYPKAAALFLEALRFDINNPTLLYNLACCYALMGDDANAARMLARAWRAGFRNLAHIEGDADFERVRNSPRFAATADSLSGLTAREVAGGTVLWIDAVAQFPCWLRLPDPYDSTRTYPLVLGLHGFGSSPESFLAVREYFGATDFFFAALRAPYLAVQDGFSWSRRDAGPQVDATTTSATIEYIATTIREIRQRYPVSEVHLLGFSQGARTAYLAGIRHPELIDGVLAFGGWLETDLLPAGALERGKGVRVVIAHGRDDQVIAYREAVQAEAILRAAGYDLTLIPFDGAHTVGAGAVAAGWKWMRRDALPPTAAPAGTPALGSEGQAR